MTTFRSYHDVPLQDSVDTIEPVVNYGEDRTGINAMQLAAAGPVAATGVVVDLDCTGLACPGPIMALQARMAELAPGDEVLAHVSDPGFRLDAPAWAAKNGHSMLELVPEGPGYAARFRKGRIGIVPGGPAARLKDKKSFVVFSGEFDRVLASFILANAAASMGDEVSMFFTFWGLNALRRQDPPSREKNVLDRAFSAVPLGAGQSAAVHDEHAGRRTSADQEDHEGSPRAEPARVDRLGAADRGAVDRLHDDHGSVGHRP